MQDEKFSSVHMFDGTNYGNWKFKLMALLNEHEMKKFIENDLQTTLDGLSNQNQKPQAEKLERKAAQLEERRQKQAELLQAKKQRLSEAQTKRKKALARVGTNQ